MDPIRKIIGDKWSKNKKCSFCGKTKILEEDWGDYDDASEWACNCKR
jgi:hypothetical protein